MKRNILICAAGALIMAAALCGCGKNKTQIDSSKTYTSQEILASLDYDPLKYVTLNDYMNMDIKMPEVPEVNDEYVDAYINYLLKEDAEYVKTDKNTAENGDKVNINYSGSIDGEKFDGGTAEDQYLELGSGTYIDGFEDGIVGHKVGETFNINVKFPDDYASEEVAGKDAVFEITLNGIYTQPEMTVDDLTDAYVKEQDYGNTVAEYKEKMKEELISNNQYYIQEELRDSIQDALLENCKVTVPDSLNVSLEEIKNEYAEKAKTKNQSLEAYVKDLGYEDVDQLAKEVKTQRESSSNIDCIYQAIIKDTNMTLSGKDLQEKMDNIKNSTGQSEEEVLEMLGGFDEYLLSCSESQVLENLIDHYAETLQK